jgi:hypothetical protein
VFDGAANRATSLIGVPPASETEEAIRLVLGRAGQRGAVDGARVE